MPPIIDETIQSFLVPIADAITAVVFLAIPVGDASLPLILLWLLAGGLTFTIVLKAMPWRSAGLSLKVIQGRYTSRKDPGVLTSLQSLMTDLGGAVGLGNIGGVAIAITIGGPGAVVWIMAGGLLGMAVKMAEATLGVKYRVVNSQRDTSGGPMYYLSIGLKEQGREKLGKVLGAAFAIFAVGGTMGAGALFQSNQTAQQIVATTGGDGSFFSGSSWIIGVALAIGAGVVIIGGISWIGRVSSKLVTIMAAIYIACCLLIIFSNLSTIPAAAGEILRGAFQGEAAVGGVIGALMIGVQRAFFSNGAGLGTSGMAHSTVRTSKPATEGFVAMWSPFVDSVVVCSMTALAIVTSGVWRADDAGDGVVLTSQAFATVHAAFPVVLTICVMLFAFSTMLAHSYYGKKALGYLFGNSRKAENIYSALFLVMIVLGSAGTVASVTALADSLLFLMAIPNLIGLYLMAGAVRREILGFHRDVREGRIPEVPLDDRYGGLGPGIQPDEDDAEDAEKVSGFR